MNVVAYTDRFSTNNSKADGSSQRTYKRLVDYSIHRDDSLGASSTIPDYYYSRQRDCNDDSGDNHCIKEKTLSLHFVESRRASIHAAVSSMRTSRTSGEIDPPFAVVSSLRSTRTCGQQHPASRRPPLLTPSRKSLDSTANFGTTTKQQSTTTTKSRRRSRRSTQSTALSSSLGSRLALVGNDNDTTIEDVSRDIENDGDDDSFCTAIVSGQANSQDFFRSNYGSAGDRLSKMNWLANNVSKRNLGIHSDALPRILKVIYPNDENQGACNPAKTTNDHVTRKQLSASEEDLMKDASQRSTSRKGTRRSSCRRRTCGTTTTLGSQQSSRHMISSSSKAAPRVSASKTRRSSASFVAGSRIRTFNVGLS